MEQVAAYWELWWVWCAAALVLAILEVLAPVLSSLDLPWAPWPVAFCSQCWVVAL